MKGTKAHKDDYDTIFRPNSQELINASNLVDQSNIILQRYYNTHESGMERREILTITVDIGNSNGEQANIVIREGDEPMQLAT